MFKNTFKARAVALSAFAMASTLALAGCGAQGPTLSVSTHNNEATATLSGSTDTTSYGTLKAKNGQNIELEYNLTSGSAEVELLSETTSLQTMELSGNSGTETSDPLPEGDIKLRVTGHDNAQGSISAKVTGEESEVPVTTNYVMDPDAEPTYMTLDENGTTITDADGNPIEVEDASDGDVTIDTSEE